jgi:hypothetical protein
MIQAVNPPKTSGFHALWRREASLDRRVQNLRRHQRADRFALASVDFNL